MEVDADSGGGGALIPERQDAGLIAGTNKSGLPVTIDVGSASLVEHNHTTDTKLNNTSFVDDTHADVTHAPIMPDDASTLDTAHSMQTMPNQPNNNQLDDGAQSKQLAQNGKTVDSTSETLDTNDGTLNGKRRRHRRRQKGGKHHPRKWKPYDKLTWDEKKVLEERESRRACQKRENRFASGQAMAPYNTTQFLMEQHEPEESELHLDDSRPARERIASHRGHGEHHMISGGPSMQSVSGGSGDGSSDEYYDSNEEEIFLEKDFTEAYEQYQAEKLQSMTKDELVKEYMGLECEVEGLKRQLKTLEDSNRRLSNESGSGSQPVTPQINLVRPNFPVEKDKQTQALDLQLEIQKLRAENDKLVAENDKLKLAAKPSDLSYLNLANNKADLCL